jgi:hypothetical protein
MEEVNGIHLSEKEIWLLKKENLQLKLALIEAQVANQRVAHSQVSKQLAELGPEPEEKPLPE